MISVVTSYPLRAILRNPNATNNIAKWAMELAEFELDFVSASSSRARIWAQTSSRAFCSHSRSASQRSRLVSRVLRASSSHRRVMLSNSSHSCSSPFNFSTSCSRWLTWHARITSSSSCLVTVLARASVDAYSSYASARARWESASRWTMASTCRSKPCCQARAVALSDIVILLSMLAHS
jgi:hypothetical protein